MSKVLSHLKMAATKVNDFNGLKLISKSIATLHCPLLPTGISYINLELNHSISEGLQSFLIVCTVFKYLEQ